MNLRPVIPFEPVKAEKVPAGEQWIAQVKWDGVRVLTYNDGMSTKLFNRRLNERTLQFPELVDTGKYCNADSVIVDGEIIALEKGKPSFHNVMRRDGIRQIEKVARGLRETPIIYMIFDILYYNGDWLTDITLKQRQNVLNEIVSVSDTIQIVENFDDPVSLLEVVTAQELEGIVCKDLASKYAVNGKDKRWQKIKNYYDLVAVVGGVTFKGNIVNALLLGLFDSVGRLWYIGHAGTGKLGMAEWRSFTELVKPLILKERTFVNRPERIKTAVWVKPVITVKIKYIEWTEGHTLRQPSIQGFVDVSPEECRLE